MSVLVVVVPTGTANLASVRAALARLGARARVAEHAAMIADAERVVLPGVGSFGAAMAGLREAGLDRAIAERVQAGRSTLAMCVGLQVLFETSDESPAAEGMERPHVAFVPSPALGGLVFYDGDAFPAWERNLFIAALQFGETPRTGHLIRIAFNENWEELRREMLLTDLHQRIRDVVQGPDDLLYVITAEDDGAVLKIEPAD